ncbi:MAG TPA: adenylate/guanylate cyclase domain-containing protein [Anaerolineae bacterium]|nr:adenylate/guanylate cyclase domain-containing protein [Anaerolineae bacterium]HMR63146.1 adenylate/guanylate cyclase domain-containing protein [Anaerolineae bacterium]
MAQVAIKQDMSSPRATTEQLLERITELESELNDLQILYETTMDHGTSLENELMAQNDRMTTLQNKMRKYLSPQLYQALVGGTTEANTKSHARTPLSIYFSDVVGFSDLTDSIEPELLSDILNSYLTRMSEIALNHGGTVDKFIGDAIMVFFGAPEYIDDVTHAQRCVRMALEMREALFQLRETWKVKGITRNLQIRAGINSGICTVGNFGSDHRMDYTIIGGQVNLAARLEAAAPPDGIYMSEASYSLVEEIVEARRVGPLQVKGIHAPVEVWELIGLRDDRAASSPYLTIDENRLQLTGFDVDVTTLSEQERAAIQKALARAMLHLSMS